MAALFSLLINKYGQKGDRHLNKCTAYPSGSQICKKEKEVKMREEELAAKSRNIQVTIFSDVRAYKKY